METNLTNSLKEAAKDILTEDVLKEIEAAFETSVNEKVKLHVEKALNEQDADYASKLEKLIEAIDTDHTGKLKKVVEAIDSDRANKLKTVIEKYESVLNKEAGEFKSSIVEHVSKYLDLYLEEKVPTTSIQEAVKNKKAYNLLEDLRKTLSIDLALASDSIRDAVVDGKSKIDEAAKQLEAAHKQVTKLVDENKKLNAQLVLEKKVSNLDDEKKSYMKKMLGNRTAEFIMENYDYTLKLFDQSEEERLKNLKSEAIAETITSNVDRPVIEEATSPVQDLNDPSFNAYMSELNKY